MLTLKQIDYALAVGKNLHFKKAADECYVSPSTLSNAITELETQLGVKIFERNNKKVIVTSLGHEILSKAKKIKLEVKNIHELAQHNVDGLSSSLSIGIIPTISPYFLPLVLPKIQKEFSNLQLKIEEGQSQILTNRVKEGDLDMAILALPYDVQDLMSFKFWEEDFFWVSHSQNKNAGKSEIRASELEHSELMLLEDGHCLKDHILDACNIDSSSQYSLKASSLNTLIQLVKGKMGTTLVPEMALKELVGNKKDLSISHLDEPGPHREIALIIRPNYAGMESVKILIDFFGNSLRELDKN
ncbi:LysR substrate-binding domain-containing protein [Pseudomonadota bacterium]|nr:LysR substrate-binding domain-containing protein [Pseudomonadota bacterium]MDC0180204.1 LysR substrate-binding domain-containing protein [Pseudomonadota bacterium]|tara:strand:+ start:23 stop:925 length:903 start_codon:yes stop_codon:yes gene_type:complete